MTRRLFFALLVAALPLGFAACASSGGTASQDRDVLTLEELRPYDSQDAYTVIRRLRNSWFNARNTGSAMAPEQFGSETQVQVYIDGVRSDRGIDALRDIRVREIQRMEKMNGRDATMMYGTDHGAGAIMVTTGR